MTDSIQKKPLKKGTLVFIDKENFIKELHHRGYDNPKLSELSETALKEILKNEESFYKRNSKE